MTAIVFSNGLLPMQTLCRRISAAVPCGTRSVTTAKSFITRVAGLGSGSIDLDTSNPLVARVTVNNPTAKNALSGRMMVQLSDAVHTLETEYKGIAVVLHGAGGTFCSGADLQLVKDCLTTPEDGLAMADHMHATLRRFKALPLISIALIEGYAVGGGSELSMATDFRILAPDAVIQFKHAMLALVPGWGGGTALTGVVGRKKALEMMCSAKPMSGPDALSCGLADVVTTSSVAEDMEAALQQFLKPYVILAQRGPGAAAAIRAAKSIVGHADAGEHRGTVTSMAHERAVFGTLWASSDNKKQVTATLHGLKKK